MSDLVILNREQPVTTSLQVANVFDKYHRNVLRAIDDLKKDVLSFEQMFWEDTIADSYNRPRRAYYMNHDGFMLLAMGFNGKKAFKFKLEYIAAFNSMEKKLKQSLCEVPQTLPEALRLAADQAEQIAVLQPKADYTDKVLANTSLVTTTTIAKNYGYSAIEFNKLLHTIGLQFKQGRTWLLYSMFQGKGYAHIEPYEYEEGKLIMRMKWTQKGVKFIHDTLKEEGVLPVIEKAV